MGAVRSFGGTLRKALKEGRVSGVMSRITDSPSHFSTLCALARRRRAEVT